MNIKINYNKNIGYYFSNKLGSVECDIPQNEILRFKKLFKNFQEMQQTLDNYYIKTIEENGGNIKTGKEYNNQFLEKEITNEIWKDMIEYEEQYQISNLGRVRGKDRQIRCKNNKYRTVKGKLMSVKINRKRGNYVYVILYNNTIAKTYRVSRLVLETFIGKCLENMECCHNDGNSLNNRLVNLRWDSSRNNHADKIKHNTILRGEKSPNSKLTMKQVLEMREDYDKGIIDYKEIGRKYNISAQYAPLIINKRRWTWLK